MNELVTSAPLDQWKTYLDGLVFNSSSMLPTAFADEHFDFYGRKLTGQKVQRPRWRRCVQAVDRDLGEALGEAYVDRTFGADGKQRMLKMVNALEESMGQDIDQLDLDDACH